MGKNRLEELDIARGIGILLVIMGHLYSQSSTLNNIQKFVYTFHMPLFFIIAGCTFTKKESFCRLIKKKGKRLLLPYYITAFMLFMLSIAQGLYRKNLKGVFRNGMLAILYASGNEHNSPFFIPSIGAIWFLWAMFGALVIFQTIANMKLRHLVAVILFYCGILSSKYVWLPLSVQAAMTAVLFMDIGYSFKGRIIGGGIIVFLFICACVWILYSVEKF